MPWSEHETNQEIREMEKGERTLPATSQQRRKKWLEMGHVLRQNSSPKTEQRPHKEQSKDYSTRC